MMERKKEIQGTLSEEKKAKASDEEFSNILKLVAPGTHFRTGLDGISRGGKGALIVVGNESILSLIDGGFRINARFTPQRLTELSKMDGSIILSFNMKRIEYANVLLTPSSSTKSDETGTRHKAAERTSKQTGALVIAISERRNEITLFYKNIRYPLRNTEEILGRVNQHIHTMEKHKEVFDDYIIELTKAEFYDYFLLDYVITIIQRGRLIQKIMSELKSQIIELGKEGLVMKTRLKELVLGVERETNFVLKDYSKIGLKKTKNILEDYGYDELLDKSKILDALGYEELAKNGPIRGWRLLVKTCLNEAEVAQLLKKVGELNKIDFTKPEKYEKFFGKEKAAKFIGELNKLKDGA